MTNDPNRLPQWTTARNFIGGVDISLTFPPGTLHDFHHVMELVRRDLGVGPSPYPPVADNPDSVAHRREVAADVLAAIDVDQYLIDAVRNATPPKDRPAPRVATDAMVDAAIESGEIEVDEP